ncbi:MAG: hypothetical protein WAL87_08695 [Chthoniobacterales bacterium]
MSREIPILMPTAPRYLALAQWTCGQIARFWPGHPDIIICGAEGDPRCLPLKDDPADWMRIVARACEDLLVRGKKQVYLILDDHPPIAGCNGDVLERVLPEMAEELGATTVLSVGYGPLIQPKGSIAAWRTYHPERLPMDAVFKLSLHPALWNLERLHMILTHLIVHLPSPDHNPWAFERIGSDPDRGVVRREWLASCWRVGGLETSTPEAAALHDWKDRGQRGWRRLQGLIGKMAGTAETIDPLLHPRIGPYPCFWSGVMKKGKINADYLAYAGIKKRTELTNGLEEAFSQCRS